MASPQAGDVRAQARDLLIRTKILKFFAASFALMGLVVFLVLYFRNIDGRLFEALSNPFTIVMIVFPFLPAVVLSWLASRTESRFFDIVRAHQRPDPPKDS